MSSSVGDDGVAVDRSRVDVITADQFERAAIASGRTMAELASLLGVGRSTIHMYRNQGVSRPRMVETVRRAMALWLRDESGNTFAGYTDDDLVREVQRRLQRVQDLISRTSDTDGSDLDTTHDASTPGDEGGRYTGTGGPA